MKVAPYIAALRSRPDRATIRVDWIQRANPALIHEVVQAQGQITRRAPVAEPDYRYAHVVLLPGGAKVRIALSCRRLAATAELALYGKLPYLSKEEKHHAICFGYRPT